MIHMAGSLVSTGLVCVFECVNGGVDWDERNSVDVLWYIRGVERILIRWVDIYPNLGIIL